MSVGLAVLLMETYLFRKTVKFYTDTKWIQLWQSRCLTHIFVEKYFESINIPMYFKQIFIEIYFKYSDVLI